jgi:hypothetical protein
MRWLEAQQNFQENTFFSLVWLRGKGVAGAIPCVSDRAELPLEQQHRSRLVP